MAIKRKSLSSTGGPLGDLVEDALLPACRRRGFASASLIAHWADIAGPLYGAATQPEKLSWPRTVKGGEEREPAVLTLRASGAIALRLAHEMPQLIERINMFYGYRCVGRIRLRQVPLATRDGSRRRASLSPLTGEEAAQAAAAANGIAHPGLRQAVERLGQAVIAARRSERG